MGVIAIGSRITGTGSFLPETRLTNQMLEQMVDTSDEWIVQRTGIRERRVAVDMQAIDVALPAAQRALDDAGRKAEDIDLIIACTVTPDSFTPTLSCALQDRLGAAHAFAFDLSAACSGFVYATDVADSYLRCGKAKCVLVVCAEVLSHLIDYTDRTVCCLFGDGAGAAVYEWSDAEDGILGTYMRSDGKNGNALFAPAFAAENPLAMPREANTNHYLHMDGKTVFRFTARAVPDAIDGVLHRAGMDISQVDWIVPHQANMRILDMVIRRYGLPAEKVFSNLDRVGNTSSASVPICLDEMRRQGLLKDGQTAIFVGFGGGLTYGAVLIRL
ncbi:beta-ketoacyl-ACP synthase III [Butyricicoccus porcorum]|uniref:Beta-ketoacyl-[acyl-carrier-protein] synthase III n=1 Tax=Butyricicoccus porcorum TaxID=1945634 RepID=A0A252F701_9FIRM|nr:beta-ketoacyl-ACP synthase III [Butyricicoccus porcorum]MCI6927097.1 ketoacyl-ACP synthase III [Butyricicoccus porcorum]MDD6986309.1 ketoacyl-ACP synthase III [Butyricicoccus porcorum]MDY4483612.1 beta-ketoacyl-ACP synthase III [Butyricicoccus porcorum]OUM21430.1 3-oxoacyl-ACP synthase [Butyricicoccus porcorum]